MAQAAQPPRGDETELRRRLRALGSDLAERERPHAEGMARAWQTAEALHSLVADALAAFHDALRSGGAPHLAVALSAPRVDDKHARAVQFELRRGRHVAVVTVKSRGEVTLVGPFREGKDESGCRTHPIDARDAIESALGELLAQFLEQAATP